jgi:hypothetical protein
MLLRSTFVTVTNTRDNKFTKKKNLFWLTLLDLSGLLTLGPDWKQHSVMMACIQNHLAHIWEKRRERGRGGGPIVPFKVTPPVTGIIPTRSLTFYRFFQLPASPNWGLSF